MKLFTVPVRLRDYNMSYFLYNIQFDVTTLFQSVVKEHCESWWWKYRTTRGRWRGSKTCW